MSMYDIPFEIYSWVYLITDIIMNEKSYSFEINGLKRKNLTVQNRLNPCVY